MGKDAVPLSPWEVTGITVREETGEIRRPLEAKARSAYFLSKAGRSHWSVHAVVYVLKSSFEC